MPSSDLRLVAPTFTPFRRDLSLDLRMIPAYADRLRESGIRDVFVNGTTGEGASLTAAEQVELIRAWVAAAGSDMTVIAHVGHASVAEAQGLARAAQEAGAAAIAATPPYYFRPLSLDPLVEVMGRIAGAAPELPFHYYHIPAMTGVAQPMWTFQERAAAAIPTFAGIKFTHEDLADYRLCLDGAGTREIFFGRDEMLLGALATGARSAVGSTYNLMPYLYRDMAAAWAAGDIAEARRLQSTACRIIEAAKASAPLPAFKVMMTFAGVDCGPCRPPLPRLDAAATTRLRDALAESPFRMSA